MQPSDSLPPVGRGSGRPWPVAYPVPRATRRKKGLPGAWAVLFQRAVGSDPAGCASRRAHRVETAIAFRLHNALGTQNERYFVAVNPTAHSLACLRIGVFVTADAARLATGVGGSPFTGRVSHPLDGKQSFMTSPHRHSPLTSLAWSHCAPTPEGPVTRAVAERLTPSTRRLATWSHSRRAQRRPLYAVPVCVLTGPPADRAAVPSASAPLRRNRAVAHDVEAQFSTGGTPALGAGHPVDRVHRSRVPGGTPRFSPTISEVKATVQQRPAQAP